MALSERDNDRQGPSRAPAAGTSPEPAVCTSCSNGTLAAETVRAAFWEGDRLVVVDGIPALVCQACGEKYYEDETAMRLDFLRGTGFPPEMATDSMTVPVFAFEPAEGGKETG